MAKPQLKFASSFDDGHSLDMTVAELLKRYNLPAVFYVPNNADLTPEEIIELADRFEIGGHTYSHPADMKLLDRDMQELEINTNKYWLESILGGRITKFCYPRGRYNETTIELVELAGYESARTTEVLKTITGTNPFTQPTTVHIYQRKEYGEYDWYDVAVKFAEYASTTGGTFHLWGHSWEISKFNNWGKLEELFKHLTETYEIVPT